MARATSSAHRLRARTSGSSPACSTNSALRSEVLLATKGGHTRTDGGGWALDSSPEHLRAAVDASLQRLGVDQLALWQHHRPDPNRDYADIVGTLKEIHDSGKVRMVGISNADSDQIRLAHSVLGAALVSVQNEFSPAFRSSRPEIDVCEELGLAFLPWSPLGGLNSAKGLADKYPAFKAVADHHGVSAQRVALAWELAQSECVIPIPGAKRPESITDSAAAADLELSPKTSRRWTPAERAALRPRGRSASGAGSTSARSRRAPPGTGRRR